MCKHMRTGVEWSRGTATEANTEIMSNNDNEIPTNADGVKVIGKPEDVDRFRVNDVVIVYLHMRDDIFMQYPFGEIGVVTALEYSDGEYLFHMPCVQFATELRMFNPEHLIVQQAVLDDDGSVREAEHDRLNAMAAAIAKAQATAETADSSGGE